MLPRPGPPQKSAARRGLTPQRRVQDANAIGLGQADILHLTRIEAGQLRLFLGAGAPGAEQREQAGLGRGVVLGGGKRTGKEAGKGTGKGSTGDWTQLQRFYGFANEAEALAFSGNPVDRLAPLV